MNKELCQSLVGIVFNYLQDCDNKKLLESINLVSKAYDIPKLKVFNIVTDCIDKYAIKLSKSIVNLRYGYVDTDMVSK